MWRTIGHDKAINALRRGQQEGRLSHAYLLVGPRQVGKMTLAVDLARMVNCLGDDGPCGECGQCRRIADGLHADVRVLGLDTPPSGDGRSRVAIGINQVREVQREATLKPYEGRCRVFIFDRAEHLSEEAANSLLKILEEPPEQVIMVLLASDAGGLLPTIVSRCQQLQLRPLPVPRVAHELEARYDADHEKAEEIARLSGGRVGWALEALSEPDLLARRAERLSAIESAVRGGLEERFSYSAKLAHSFGADRESTLQELALWQEWWRDVLVIKEGAPDLVTNLCRVDTLRPVAVALSAEQIADAIMTVQETLDNLDRNINPRLALDELMLAMPSS